MKTSYLDPQPCLDSDCAICSDVDEALFDIFDDDDHGIEESMRYAEAWLNGKSLFDAHPNRAIPFLAHLEVVTGRSMIHLIADKKTYRADYEYFVRMFLYH